MVSAGSAANALPLECEHSISSGCARDAVLARTEACLLQTLCLTGSESFTWCLATDEIIGSEQLLGMLGFEPGLVVTFARIVARVHPDDLPEVHLQIERARRERCDVALELRLLLPDRQAVRHLRLAARPVWYSQLECDYVGAVQDMTPHRLCEAALREARAELAFVARVMSLGVLSASIAHEIKQPLSGIITNASTCLRMLAAEPPDLVGARETAKRTLRDGNRASDIITRLRALFVRKTASGEAVDLNQLTHEAITLALSDLNRRRITVLLELADDMPTVKGDRVQLHQVILNLILNAADAMGAIDDRPRRLRICTQREGYEGVLLSVQDNGTGFGAHAARLFEPFYTTKSDGMGIGLSISHTIIASHGGRLWASANQGPGATFCFSIPRAQRGPRPAACVPAGDCWAGGGRVLREDSRAEGLGL
jgi:signal transduction histidine kinase